MDNQKTHVVELDFFEIFLPYSFRLIGPQTKQGNMHPCSAKIGLRLRKNFYSWRYGCSVYPFVTNGLRLRVIKKCFKLGQKIFLFKTIYSMTPLYLLKKVFSNI
jgi:hypothetical protein